MGVRQSLWYCSQVILLLALFFVALCYLLALSLGLDFSRHQFAFGLGAYGDILKNPRIVGAFLTSLQMGLWVALVVVPVALLVAWQCLNISNARIRLVVLSIFVMPLLSSSLLRMFGYSAFLSEGGPLTSISILPFLQRKMLFSEAGTIFGLVSLVLPISIIVYYIRLRHLAVDIMASAKNLGASVFQIFWRIEVPTCRAPAIMIVQVSVLFSFADTFAQSILGGNSVYTFAAALSDRIKINDWEGASAMATLLVLFTVSVVVAIVRVIPNSVHIR